MRSAAFFDVDYTILQGSSSIMFMNYLLFRGKISLKYIVSAAIFFTRYKLNRISYEYLSKNIKLPIIEKKTIKQVNNLSKRFFSKVLIKKIRKKAKKRIEFHRKNNQKIVLASASMDFLLKPLAKHLNADLVCTTTEIKNKIYTGKLSGPVCYGKNKKQLVKDYANKNKIDLKNSFSYSDHVSDLLFLQLTGKPYFVNPNFRLKKIAKTHKIKTISF
ncbi:HAD-IB family hydrolase [Candidatus Woesearchaeota archaeon]|nr:HAD-IB family hydrolase [Candidatus Woesearchaeota archaeon]